MLRASGLDPVLWPRIAGAYPGFLSTGRPLSLASSHFGVGHGGGAHAPDGFYLIDSTDPKVEGYDGAMM